MNFKIEKAILEDRPDIIKVLETKNSYFVMLQFSI